MSEELAGPSTEEIEHHLVMGQALIRLRNNPDFKLLIEDNYLKSKILASVSMLSVPQISENGKRPGVMEDLISASNLQYFFMMVDNFYQGAKEGPILSDQEQEELAQQELEQTNASIN